MAQKLASIAAAAAIALASSAAASQQVTVDLSPEVRAQFREHVVVERIAPATVEADIAVGTAVPDDVQLSDVPVAIVDRVPELERHVYFVSGKRIYVVRPTTRTVVTVIDE